MGIILWRGGELSSLSVWELLGSTNTRVGHLVLDVGYDGSQDAAVDDLLNNMLRAIQLSRKPAVENLDMLLRLSKTCVLIMGTESVRQLLGGAQSVERLRENSLFVGEHKLPVFVTYHPAVLLKQPYYKRKAWADLQRLSIHIKNALSRSGRLV